MNVIEIIKYFKNDENTFIISNGKIAIGYYGNDNKLQYVKYTYFVKRFERYCIT